MKVMWLVNVKLPVIYKAAGEENKINVGGWLDQISGMLLEQENIELVVVYPTDNSKGEHGVVGNLEYYGVYFNPKLLRKGTLNESVYVPVLEKILREINPDVIHIHGTEFQYSYFMTLAAKNCELQERVVISIQGLVSFYAYHYLYRIPFWVRYGCTIKEIALNENMNNGWKSYRLRGEAEKRALQNTRYIIGRTNWDRGCSYLINPKAKYLFCNETLRSDFYEGNWMYEKCEPHTIFISQASYSIKGFHLFIDALKEVKMRFSDVKVRVAGPDMSKGNFIKGSFYALYIQRLLRKYGLEENVTFLGSQNVMQMKQEMLRANVFVSCSTIENSPNSLGEAMILGVPCISSDVGGVANLLIHNEEGYIYPLDETYMLTYYIINIFSDPENAKKMGQNAIKHATRTHDSKENFEKLMRTYIEISAGEIR